MWDVYAVAEDDKVEINASMMHEKAECGAQGKNFGNLSLTECALKAADESCGSFMFSHSYP